MIIKHLWPTYEGFVPWQVQLLYIYSHHSEKCITCHMKVFTRVACPNFDTLVYKLCRCCRHTTKIINHHSKAETISKLRVHSQLLQNLFSPAKVLCFVNNEDRAGCPKLGHTTLISYSYTSTTHIHTDYMTLNYDNN